MKRIIATVAFATATLAATPQTAEAAISNTYGYACWVRLNNPSGFAGDHGSVYVSMYSEPACAGSYLGFGYLYSEGSSYPPATAAHTEARIQTYFHRLSQAAESGQQLYIYTLSAATCGGSTGCIDSVAFLAN
jgi:hypothetical protein